MNEGYIKLFRKFKKWEWYSDINTKTLFLHLLLSANHKDTKWKNIIITEGQLLTGRKQLSKQTKLTEQEIRTSLKHLQLTNEITIKSTNKYSIITLLNWGKYQVCEKKQPTNQPTNAPITNHKQEIKEEKNKRNNNNITTNYNIYLYLEEAFGRTIAPSEVEKIDSWLLVVNEEMFKYAVDQCVYYGMRTFSYLEGILKNWQGCNYKTLDEVLHNKKTKKEIEKEEQDEMIDSFFKERKEKNERGTN